MQNQARKNLLGNPTLVGLVILAVIAWNHDVSCFHPRGSPANPQCGKNLMLKIITGGSKRNRPSPTDLLVSGEA